MSPSDSTKEDRGLRRYDWLVGAVGIRGRMRSEMNEVFRDALRDARASGGGALLRLWAVAAFDLVRTAIRRPVPPRARASRGRWLDSVAADLRHGLRSLKRSPGFTVVVVLTLALAIGVNSTIFSLTRLVLFPPMPIDRPSELVFVRATNPELNRVRAAVSLPDFDDLRRRSTTLEELAAYAATSFTLTDAGEPTRVAGSRSTVNLFDALGVEPRLGRGFNTADGRAGAAPVAILSHGAWERRFGADAAIIGGRITLEGASHTVIGILPAELEIGAFAGVEVWTPLMLDPARAARDERNLSVVGRLRDGATVEHAAADLASISVALQEDFPGTNGGWRTRVLTFRQAMTGENAATVSALMGISVLFVLIIACANVGNLLLARATTRRDELAVRQALGARRRRLVRQLLTESALLAFLGSVVGFVLAWWALRGFVLIGRDNVTLVNEARIDGGVFLFALGLGSLTPLLFGVIPALRSTRMNLATSTKEATRGNSPTVRNHRLLPGSRGSLAALQVALAVVLLVVSSLAMRTVSALVQMDLGFEAGGLLTLGVDLPQASYEGPSAANFFSRTLAEIEATAEVAQAAWVSHLPITGGEPMQSATIEGRSAASDAEVPWLATVTVSPGFFETLRIPLRAGRLLYADDDRASRPVALVSDAAAQRYWAGDDPVGNRIKLGPRGSDSPWIEIIGVVADIRNPDADQPPEPHLYLPLEQHPATRMSLVARARADAAASAPAVRQAIWEIDEDLPIDDVRTFGEVLYDDFSGDITVVALVASFGLVALSLATAGVYGAISYSVSQRNREIGIRMALGAGRPTVLVMVVGEGLATVLTGLALGLVGGFGASRMMAGLLFGIGPNDPVTFLGIPAVLAIVGVLASLVPAVRATRVNPIDTIRAD